MGYGTAQKLGFAGMIIGALLCIAGTAAPYWLQGKVDGNSLASMFSYSIPVFGSTTFLEYFAGIWWYCMEYFGETKCGTNVDADDDDAKSWVMRIGSVVCCALSLFSALIGLCQTCCGSGGRTVGHGFIAFLGGAAGITTIGIFASVTNADSSIMELYHLDYAWAFFIFIAGTAIILITSIMLCVAVPDNEVGHVISMGAPANTFVVANSTQAQSFGGFQQPNPYMVNAWQQQQQPNGYNYINQSFAEEPQKKNPGWA